MIAIDFETFYDSKNGYGIKELGVHKYIHHDLFDPYMVAICNGHKTWCDRPENIRWEKILCSSWDELEEDDYLCVDLCAHNALFDRQVFTRCQELGLIPKWIDPDWTCTANMTTYLGMGRSLAEAAKNYLGIEVNKEMRAYMDGRQWVEVKDTEAGQKLIDYAKKDAEYCWKLAEKGLPNWPSEEQKASEITMQQCMRGIYVDVPKLERGMKKVLSAHLEAYEQIPWAGQLDEFGKEFKPTSPKAMKQACGFLDLPIPESFADGDSRFEDWHRRYGDQAPFIKEVQKFRSTNILHTKSEILRTRVREDGTFPFELKYFGAHTGRWSGGFEDDDRRVRGTGFNIQNLPRTEMYGLNLRHCLRARPGHKLVLADYAQIEPRVLCWIIKDHASLKLMSEGMSPYEVHARVSMGWTGGPLKKENLTMYQLAKARVLALGYGAGWRKFLDMARLYVDEASYQQIFSAEIEKSEQVEFEEYLLFLRERFPHWQEEYNSINQDERIMWINSWKQVRSFREDNPKIKNLWDQLDSGLRGAAGGDFQLRLPSGRVLKYLDVKSVGGMSVVFPSTGLRRSIWGGFLTENLCQSISRDLIRDALIDVERAGIRTLFTVHDEIVSEVKKDFDSKIIIKIMETPRDWIPGLPIEVEAKDSDHYEK